MLSRVTNKPESREYQSLAVKVALKAEEDSLVSEISASNLGAKSSEIISEESSPNLAAAAPVRQKIVFFRTPRVPDRYQEVYEEIMALLREPNRLELLEAANAKVNKMYNHKDIRLTLNSKLSENPHFFAALIIAKHFILPMKELTQVESEANWGHLRPIQKTTLGLQELLKDQKGPTKKAVEKLNSVAQTLMIEESSLNYRS